jgi:hypothetical protein
MVTAPERGRELQAIKLFGGREGGLAAAIPVNVMARSVLLQAGCC